MGGMTRSGTADVVAEDSSGGCHGKLRRGVLRGVRKAEEPPRGTAVHTFMRSTTCLGTGAACEPSNKNRKQPKRLIVVYRECFNERKGEMRSDGEILLRGEPRNNNAGKDEWRGAAMPAGDVSRIDLYNIHIGIQLLKDTYAQSNGIEIIR